MNKIIELLVGLILVVAAILVWVYSLEWGGFWNFGTAAWEFFKGGLIWLVILIGFLFLMLGISDLKE
ncbi:MAG: hypothetical protein ACP5D2_03725 [Candidatus Nanoarchaeia archaeon]